MQMAVFKRNAYETPCFWPASMSTEMTKKQRETESTEGQQRYAAHWATQMQDPEFQEIYIEEAAKKELWLQLADARRASNLTQAELAARLGITQSQVSRLEKPGYETYSLTTKRRYVAALGRGITLEIKIQIPGHEQPASEVMFCSLGEELPAT